MRSDVVETRPPQHTDVRTSNILYQPDYPYPGFEPRYYRTRPARYTARERQFKFAPAEGWFSLLLLGIAVYSVVFSIVFANWVDFSNILLFSTAVGLLLGLCVAKIQWFPQAILHLTAVLLGHWLSIWLVSTFAYHISWMTLLANLRSVISGGFTSPVPANSEMVFLFYLTFLSYFLAYFGVWLIYRAHLPWLVALIYCSIMLVNLNYIKQDLSYLVVIMLAALSLLIVRMHLVNQITQWTSEGLFIDRAWVKNITRRFVQIGALFTLIILLVSLILPMASEPNSGAKFWNNLNNIWTNITHGQFTLNSPGALLQPYQAPTEFFGDQLSITGNVNLPSGEMFSYYTSSPRVQPQYLEGFTYDHFDGHTWISTINDSQSYKANALNPSLDAPGNFDSLVTTVTIENPIAGTKHYLFAPAQPFSFNVPVVLYGNGVTTAWTQPGPPATRYRVLSHIPAYSASQLSTVPLPQDNQVFWSSDANMAMLNQYLQKPNDLTPKEQEALQQTVRTWIAGSSNAYSAMNKLVSHFTSPPFIYSVSNPPVPSNVDAVSWLLQTHQGYCTYYATAMVIMARLLHIPARIVNGFTQGRLQNNGSNTWIVYGSDAHSWVQVYFPRYGWINFDPTPGYPIPTASTTQQNSPPVKKAPALKPTPIATMGRTKQQPQSTSISIPGTGKTGINIVTTNAQVPENLFLLFSLVILFTSLVVFGFALLKRYQDYRQFTLITATAVYRRVCRLGALIGISPKRWQTPYEYYLMLGRRYPLAAAPMRRITDLFVRERWAHPQHAPDPSERQALEKLWQQLRNTLIRSFFSRGRRTS